MGLREGTGQVPAGAPTPGQALPCHCPVALLHGAASTALPGAAGNLASLQKSRYSIDWGHGNVIYLQTKLGIRCRLLQVFTSKALSSDSTPTVPPLPRLP